MAKKSVKKEIDEEKNTSKKTTPDKKSTEKKTTPKKTPAKKKKNTKQTTLNESEKKGKLTVSQRERDEIDAVVDYDYLRTLVNQILISRRFNLLESLASEILEGCLHPPEVIGASVSVSKLAVIEGEGEIGCSFSRIK